MNSILLREDKVREILENHRMVMRKVVKPQPLNAKKFSTTMKCLVMLIFYVKTLKMVSVSTVFTT